MRNSLAFGVRALVGTALGIWLLATHAVAEDAATKTVPYRTAHDAALDATERANAVIGGHRQLRVEFNGIQNDRVPGYLYLPKGAIKAPAVLLQYGSGGHKGTDYIVEIAWQFVAGGFVVLTIDSPQRGERANKEARKIDFFLDRDKGRDLFLQYLGDYSRAVDYLATRPEVDRNRLGYLGISWGAITGITYVAHEPRIKAMVSMVGGGNVLGILGNEVPAALATMVKQIDPVYHIAHIAPRPLLLLNVTKDQLVPKACAEALHKAAGKGTKSVWMETDHYFRGVDRKKVGDDMVKFLKENLPKE